jgi:hypothetical protein
MTQEDSVERGSDKHGPRQDEQLAHEVEGLVRGAHATHAQEWKDPEPSGEDQPDVDRAPHATLVGGVPAGLSPEDVELRSELASVLGKEIYPVTGEQACAVAESNGAPDRILSLLRRLDAGATYANVQDIWSALGGGAEAQRF